MTLLLYGTGRAVNGRMFGQVFTVRVLEELHISCNTGPDMAALALRCCIPLGVACPRASCVHIRQCTCACVVTIT